MMHSSKGSRWWIISALWCGALVWAIATLGCSPSKPTNKTAETKRKAPTTPIKSRWAGVARGVAWDANWEDRTAWYGTESAKKGLDSIKRIGVDWIAITPFSFQRNIFEPSITSRPGWDRGLDQDVKNAHDRGIKVMVKPHIWSNQFWDGSGHWRGHIKMSSEADWIAWFRNYETWIVAEAKLAQELGADAFCIGLEYLESSRAHADRWRQIIRAVREVFHGPLTYGAHEAEMDLPFWDELDVIGVNAYYPVATDNNPTSEQIKTLWGSHIAKLEALSARFNRPIVFTEVGYASIDGAAKAPFRWPNGNDREDRQEQADCYKALFELAPQWPWFGGMFIWKYKIGVESDNPAERHYVFQGKEAEAVIQAGFSKTFARD